MRNFQNKYSISAVSMISLMAGTALSEDCPTDALDMSLLQRQLKLHDPRKVSVENKSYMNGDAVYGKYFQQDLSSGAQDYSDNTLSVMQPKGRHSEKLPVIIRFLGAGFCYPTPTQFEDSEEANWPGFVVINVAYRRLTKRYYYQEANQIELEEFVDISQEGGMVLDRGRTYNRDGCPDMTVGYQEAMPKAVWDGVQALEYVISNSEQLGVDVNQMVLQGTSAGTSIANYLTWVYWQRHQQRFTVKALGLKVPQLNYPIPPNMYSTLHLFAETVTLGKASKLADYFDTSNKTTCTFRFGNMACDEDVQLLFCDAPIEYDWCGQIWHEHQMSAICNNESVLQMTLGDAIDLTWEPSQAYYKALHNFLYHEDNMKSAQNKNVYVYALTMYNGSELSVTEHHSVYTESYAKVASQEGIPYVAYYADFKDMKPELSTAEKFVCKQERSFLAGMYPELKNRIVEYNYKSNFGWRSIYDSSQPEGLDDTWQLTTGEFMAFMCYALGSCHNI